MQVSIARCAGCRQSTLRAFASLAGISIPIQPHSRFIKTIGGSTPRSFASSSRLREVEQSAHQNESGRSSSTSATTFPPSQGASNDESSSSASASSSPIPWYLQIETPTPPAPVAPHMARQEIPEIPTDAPKILSPVLHHLSDQIGLDNLTLIDLRHLDPPAALGANLLMIIGTARSYKHLNTSADRFCRWLRSRYKLSPYADGLLGRNEVKLKLRRKARKMKLAQSVGNTVAAAAASGMDDGITTGWICVNVGRVDQAKQVNGTPTAAVGQADHSVLQTQQPEREEIDEDDEDDEDDGEQEEYQNPTMTTDVDDGDAEHNGGYVGFGSRSTAPRIVVQMFTEEKRLEMDLEGLWDHRQHRRVRKEERTDAEVRRDMEETAFTAKDSTGSTPAAVFQPWT